MSRVSHPQSPVSPWFGAEKSRALWLALVAVLLGSMCNAQFTEQDLVAMLGRRCRLDTPDESPCRAGFTCMPCLQGKNVKNVSDSRRECKIGRDGECQPCFQGDFCPEGSRNPLVWTGMHICPSGSYCPNATHKEECKEGFFCPSGVFSYDDEMTSVDLRCPEGKGLYCPPGADDYLNECPKGFYCPSPSELWVCPSGHFCKSFALFPSGCLLGSFCEEGAKAPGINYMGVGAAAVAMGLMLLVHRGIMRSIRAREKKSHETSAMIREITDTTRTVISRLLGIPTFHLSEQVAGFGRVQTPITIEFYELSLHIRKSPVFSMVSGRFAESRLTAVMGPSGSGKTSLLNAVAARASYGTITGDILINGHRSSVAHKSIARVTAFVPQDDTVFTELTVRENLRYSAMLRLPTSYSVEDRRKLMAGVLEVLGLDRVQHSVVGDEIRRGISGGQRKRVNIGMELVSDPTLLFLDEPTSGLGSTDTLLVMKALRSMAFLRRTVVAVIHQPRYDVFTLFHEVLLLGIGGQTVYFGEPKQAPTYFHSIGFKPPENENPADYFLDVMQGQAQRKGDAGFKPEDLFQLWEENMDLIEEVGMVSSSSVTLPEDVRAGMLKAWKRVDKDDDMEVSSEELVRLMADLGATVTQTEADAVVKVLDTDMSGTIDWHEFLRYATREYVMLKSNVYSDEDGGSSLKDRVMTSQVMGDKQFRRLSGVGRLSISDRMHRLSSAGGSEAKGPDEVKQRKMLGFWKQYRRFYQRAFVQWLRRFNSVTLGEVALLFLASLAMGLITGTDWDYEDIPRNALLSSVTQGVLATVSALKVFGLEMVVNSRERKTGLSRRAYFLGKCTIGLIDNVWQPTLFLSVYFSLTVPRMLFVHYWYIFALNTWACHGMGIFFSTALPPGQAMLAGVIAPLVVGVFLGGVDPSIASMSDPESFLSCGSFARWTAEATTIAELYSEPSYQDERVEYVYRRTGYQESNYNTCLYALAAIGLIFRVLGYLMMEQSLKKFLTEVVLVLGEMVGVERPQQQARRRRAQAEEALLLQQMLLQQSSEPGEGLLTGKVVQSSTNGRRLSYSTWKTLKSQKSLEIAIQEDGMDEEGVPATPGSRRVLDPSSSFKPSARMERSASLVFLRRASNTGDLVTPPPPDTASPRNSTEGMFGMLARTILPMARRSSGAGMSGGGRKSSGAGVPSEDSINNSLRRFSIDSQKSLDNGETPTARRHVPFRSMAADGNASGSVESGLPNRRSSGSERFDEAFGPAATTKLMQVALDDPTGSPVENRPRRGGRGGRGGRKKAAGLGGGAGAESREGSEVGGPAAPPAALDDGPLPARVEVAGGSGSPDRESAGASEEGSVRGRPTASPSRAVRPSNSAPRVLSRLGEVAKASKNGGHSGLSMEELVELELESGGGSSSGLSRSPSPRRGRLRRSPSRSASRSPPESPGRRAGGAGGAGGGRATLKTKTPATVESKLRGGGRGGHGPALTIEEELRNMSMETQQPTHSPRVSHDLGGGLGDRRIEGSPRSSGGGRGEGAADGGGKEEEEEEAEADPPSSWPSTGILFEEALEKRVRDAISPAGGSAPGGKPEETKASLSRAYSGLSSFSGLSGREAIGSVEDFLIAAQLDKGSDAGTLNSDSRRPSLDGGQPPVGGGSLYGGAEGRRQGHGGGEARAGVRSPYEVGSRPRHGGSEAARGGASYGGAQEARPAARGAKARGGPFYEESMERKIRERREAEEEGGGNTVRGSRSRSPSSEEGGRRGQPRAGRDGRGGGASPSSEEGGRRGQPRAGRDGRGGGASPSSEEGGRGGREARGRSPMSHGKGRGGREGSRSHTASSKRSRSRSVRPGASPRAGRDGGGGGASPGGTPLRSPRAARGPAGPSRDGRGGRDGHEGKGGRGGGGRDSHASPARPDAGSERRDRPWGDAGSERRDRPWGDAGSERRDRPWGWDEGDGGLGGPEGGRRRGGREEARPAASRDNLGGPEGGRRRGGREEARPAASRDKPREPPASRDGSRRDGPRFPAASRDGSHRDGSHRDGSHRDDPGASRAGSHRPGPRDFVDRDQESLVDRTAIQPGGAEPGGATSPSDVGGDNPSTSSTSPTKPSRRGPAAPTPRGEFETLENPVYAGDGGFAVQGNPVFSSGDGRGGAGVAASSGRRGGSSTPGGGRGESSRGRDRSPPGAARGRDRSPPGAARGGEGGGGGGSRSPSRGGRGALPNASRAARGARQPARRALDEPQGNRSRSPPRRPGGGPERLELHRVERGGAPPGYGGGGGGARDRSRSASRSPPPPGARSRGGPRGQGRSPPPPSGAGDGRSASPPGRRVWSPAPTRSPTPEPPTPGSPPPPSPGSSAPPSPRQRGRGEREGGGKGGGGSGRRGGGRGSPEGLGRDGRSRVGSPDPPSRPHRDGSRDRRGRGGSPGTPRHPHSQRGGSRGHVASPETRRQPRDGSRDARGAQGASREGAARSRPRREGSRDARGRGSGASREDDLPPRRRPPRDGSRDSWGAGQGQEGRRGREQDSRSGGGGGGGRGQSSPRALPGRPVASRDTSGPLGGRTRDDTPPREGDRYGRGGGGGRDRSGSRPRRGHGGGGSSGEEGERGRRGRERHGGWGESGYAHRSRSRDRDFGGRRVYKQDTAGALAGGAEVHSDVDLRPPRHGLPAHAHLPGDMLAPDVDDGRGYDGGRGGRRADAEENEAPRTPRRGLRMSRREVSPAPPPRRSRDA